jgi:hypothetical protein
LILEEGDLQGRTRVLDVVQRLTLLFPAHSLCSSHPWTPLAIAVGGEDGDAKSEAEGRCRVLDLIR